MFIGEDNAIIARDAETGADLWLHRSGGTSFSRNDSTPTTAVVAGDTVYMGFPDGRVSALEAETGEVVGRQPLRLHREGVTRPAISY